MKLKNIIFTLLAFLLITIIIFFVQTKGPWHKVNKDNSPQEQTNFDSSKEELTISLPEHSQERTFARDTVGNVNTKDTPAVKQQQQIKAWVIAYYFHPTARCTSCINIENFSKEAVESVFKKENKAGKITFQPVNIEDSVNDHYIYDYNLTSSSLVLVLYKNNVQIEWFNLDKVWTYSDNREQFINYVKPIIKQFLINSEI